MVNFSTTYCSNFGVNGEPKCQKADGPVGEPFEIGRPFRLTFGCEDVDLHLFEFDVDGPVDEGV